MSMICYYGRMAPSALGELAARPDSFFDDPPPPGLEVIDIDRAYEALGWLCSPLKRAEIAHLDRLISDSEWADSDEPLKNVARLDAMPVDDVLDALEGRRAERIAGADAGLGPASVFTPERVRELAGVLGRLTEQDLRRELDFAAMDAVDVLPGQWVDDGEGNLREYLMPGLKRLQAFYASAAEADQAMVIIWS